MTRTRQQLIWTILAAMGAAAVLLSVFGFSVSRLSNRLQLNMQFYVTDRLWMTLERWVFTPQSHRMHHANDVDYRDMNYGFIFGIWEFAFGTPNKNFDDYPATGIDDDAFPMEESELRHWLFLTPAIQMIYCFKSAGTQIMLAIKPTAA